SPEALKAMEVHNQMGRNLSLMNLAYEYFREGKRQFSPSLEDAVAKAKELYSEKLFETGYPTGEMAQQAQAGVAGVAAILLKEGNEEHWEWALTTCIQASQT